MTDPFWKNVFFESKRDRYGFRKAIVAYEFEVDDPDFNDKDQEPDLDTLGVMRITFTNADGVYEYPGIEYSEYLYFEQSRTRPL